MSSLFHGTTFPADQNSLPYTIWQDNQEWFQSIQIHSAIPNHKRYQFTSICQLHPLIVGWRSCRMLIARLQFPSFPASFISISRCPTSLIPNMYKSSAESAFTISIFVNPFLRNRSVYCGSLTVFSIQERTAFSAEISAADGATWTFWESRPESRDSALSA